MILHYPLQWPSGRPRTPEGRRKSAPFFVKDDRAYRDLLAELARLGAIDIRITTDIPRRKDGGPWAGRSWKSGDDPGVCVYFTRKGRGHAFHCDQYHYPFANLRAIGLSIQAMRALERHGTSDTLDRAFEGFAALPPPDAIDWRVELGFKADAVPSLVEVRARYREKAAERHPDRGGSDHAMSRLNRAMAAAVKEVDSKGVAR